MLEQSSMHARILLSALVLLILSGCASGPEFRDVRATIPALEAGKGRIYIYRPQYSFLYVGSVRLNGRSIRVPEAGAVLFVEVDPGDYEVVIDSITSEKAGIRVDAGQERYVRITVTTEGHFLYTIYPQLPDAASALEEMQELNFIELP